MNDLDLVRLLGAEVPITDDLARLQARSRLRTLIDRETRVGTARSTERRRRRRASTLFTAAAALMLVAVFAVLPRGADYATADELFSDLSSVAERGSADPESTGEFFYTKSERATEQGEGAGSILVEGVREIWIARDGSGRIRDQSGDEVFQPGELPFIDTDNLPADADALLRMLRGGEVFGGAPPSDVDLLADIGSLLAETHPRPELRASLLDAAGRIPGVELVGDRTDAAGRAGIAVASADPTRRIELIFDPESAALLERSAVRAGDGEGQPDRLEYRITYEESGVVETVDERPVVP
ncbi:MAG: CU044_5270 family protein [Actinomycetota bacterium]